MTQINQQHLDTQSITDEKSNATVQLTKPEGTLQKWTAKLTNLAAFFKAVASLIWIPFIVAILAGIGWYFIGNQSEITKQAVVTHIVQPPIPWNEIDKQIVKSLTLSRETARNYAHSALKNEADVLKDRVEHDFLPWYFGYWTQTMLGLKGVYHSLLHYFNDGHPDSEQQLKMEIEKKFSLLVLKPAIFKHKIAKITKKTVKIYLSTLRKKLAEIPKEYNLSQVDWQKHLDGISVTTMSVEGRSVPITLKAVTVGLGLGSVAITTALSSTIKIAQKAGTKIAAKTVTGVGVKIGGKFLGSILAVAVLAWDYYDYKQNRDKNEPILRQDLYTYIDDAILDDLLNSSENGVMSPINNMEREIIASVQANREE